MHHKGHLLSEVHHLYAVVDFGKSPIHMVFTLQVSLTGECGLLLGFATVTHVHIFLVCKEEECEEVLI